MALREWLAASAPPKKSWEMHILSLMLTSDQFRQKRWRWVSATCGLRSPPGSSGHPQTFENSCLRYSENRRRIVYQVGNDQRKGRGWGMVWAHLSILPPAIGQSSHVSKARFKAQGNRFALTEELQSHRAKGMDTSRSEGLRPFMQSVTINSE